MPEEISIRSFLETLQENNLLVKVQKTVSPRFELAAVLKKIVASGRAALFERVEGCSNRVVGGVTASRKMLALAMGVDEKNLLREYVARYHTRLKPKILQSSPLYENINDSGDAPRIPLITHFERDAGPYIVAGIVVARDPETGFTNLSFNRVQIKSGRRFGIRMMPPQHLGTIHSRCEEKKRNLEVAICIGNHPIAMMAASATLPYGDDHLEFAGGLLGKPLEVIRCNTSDLLVPAYSELVLEGEVLAGVRESEGPFGEFMQYYTPVTQNHVFELKSMMYRSDYIYQTLVCGSSEDLGLLALSREALIYRVLRDAGYDVVDVSLMPFIFNGAISIRKRFEGEPKNAAMAAFGAYPWLKYCVVVDEDVNVRDLNDVWWAIATRSKPDTGVFVIRDALGFTRGDKKGLHRTKVCIDATVPFDVKADFERKKVPGEDSIDLRDYT
ncbi:MAG: UbiD family decarboxylase [Candidatus Caldarchaeum sp.]